YGVPRNAFCHELLPHLSLIKLFKHKMVTYFTVIIEIINVNVTLVVDLHMGRTLRIIRHGLHIYAFKAYFQLVGTRDDIYTENKVKRKNNGCRNHIRSDETVEAHPATQN